MRLGSSLVLLLAFFLAGCAPTYNPHNFDVEQLSPRTLGNDPTPLVYRVFFPVAQRARPFRGGPEGSMQLEDSALLRSAELTLEKGCQYFVILRHEDAMFQPGNGGDSWAHIDLAYIIRVLREKPSAPGIVSYDAAFVREALRRHYALETVGPLPNRAAGNCGA